MVRHGGGIAGGRRRRRPFWAGVVAGFAFLLVELIGRVAAGVPTLPELVDGRLVQLLPGPVFSFVLDRLLYFGKPLLFLGLLAGQLALSGIYGSAVARWGRPWPLAGLLWLITGIAVLPLAGLGLFDRSLAEAAVGACAFAALAVAAHTYGADAPASPPAVPPRERGLDVGRRQLIGGLVGAAASLLLARQVIGRQPSAPAVGRGPAQTPGSGQAAPAPADSFAGMPPEVTSAAQFYEVSKDLVNPTVNAADWTLRVDGLVEHPLTLRYHDILALPSVHSDRTLECISNPIGGPLISNGRFTGVRMSDVLHEALPHPAAKALRFTSVDGYTEHMSLSEALNPTTLLVYLLDGKPLPHQHGYPLRVLRVNRYGMKNPKWLTRIELASTPSIGFWEQQGWSDAAIVQTMSRIDIPRTGARVPAGTVAVGGVAFSGGRGIRNVELSTDGGRTWQEARLLKPTGRFTWVLWEYRWQAARRGVHMLAVRATDGTGVIQPSRQAPSFPDGATGYDSIEVEVV